MAIKRTLSVLLALVIGATPGAAQRLIERTPNLPNSVTALPGVLELNLPHRFANFGGAAGLQPSTTFDIALGLPFVLPIRWTGGVRFAPASDVVAGESNEWEAYHRIGLLRRAAGAPIDLNITGAYNFAARSIDGEAAIARYAGPFRVLGAARVMSAPYGGSDPRFAFVAGAVWHVLPRHAGVTVSADVATLIDRRVDEEPAWSVGVQAGLPYTAMSFGLQASNAATTTLEGASRGSDRVRYGFELSAPVELVGFVLGWFTEREAAMSAVEENVDTPADQRVDIRRHLFAPGTIVIRAGQTIEWVNNDAVVHTVNSENAAFQSGAIEPGAAWRARFEEPGQYPYYCGPHPFMKGVVVVRPN